MLEGGEVVKPAKMKLQDLICFGHLPEMNVMCITTALHCDIFILL